MSVNTLRQLFCDLLKDADSPHMSFHDLRHGAATTLFAADVQPNVVAERLGHASIAATTDIYAHVPPEMQQEVVNKIDDLFKQE